MNFSIFPITKLDLNLGEADRHMYDVLKSFS